MARKKTKQKQNRKTTIHKEQHYKNHHTYISGCQRMLRKIRFPASNIINYESKIKNQILIFLDAAVTVLTITAENNTKNNTPSKQQLYLWLLERSLI